MSHKKLPKHLKSKALRATSAVTLSAMMLGGCFQQEDNTDKKWDTTPVDMPKDHAHDHGGHHDQSTGLDHGADHGVDHGIDHGVDHGMDHGTVDHGNADQGQPDIPTPVDIGPDLQPDQGPDLPPDVDMKPDMTKVDMGKDMPIDTSKCSMVKEDGVCPDTCKRTTDADCCSEDQLCYFDAPSMQCGCAVPGPFRPPEMPVV